MSRQILALTFFTALGVAMAETPTRVGIALDFGPVVLTSGQSLRLCANNLFGDKSIKVRFLILDATTGRAVAHQDTTLAVGHGACYAHDNAAVPGVAAVSTQTLIGLLVPADPLLNWSSPLSLGVTSGQIVELASSKTTSFLPAVQRFNVILPAVQ